MKSLFRTLMIVFLVNSIAMACSTCGCQGNKAKPAQAQTCGPNCQAHQKATDMAPAFTLANYDGAKVSLDDFKGKIVVIEWFSYKCPFCVYHYETVPTMHDLVEKYGDKNVQFLSINSTSWQTTEDNKAFAKKNKVSYPILDDRTGEIGRAYGATRTPHMFIINEKGKIVYQGGIDNAPMGKLPKGQDKVMNFVDMALAEITEGNEITIQKTKEYGCTVKYAK